MRLWAFKSTFMQVERQGQVAVGLEAAGSGQTLMQVLQRWVFNTVNLYLCIPMYGLSVLPLFASTWEWAHRSRAVVWVSQTIHSLPALSVKSYGLLPNSSLEQDLEILCFLSNLLVSKESPTLQTVIWRRYFQLLHAFFLLLFCTSFPCLLTMKKSQLLNSISWSCFSVSCFLNKGSLNNFL